jgi:hypothetical protein
MPHQQVPMGLPSSSNYSHIEYSGSNLPTPVTSFQQSFQQKHNPYENQQHNRIFDMNVLQNTNISGNILDNNKVPGSFSNEVQIGQEPLVPGSFNSNNSFVSCQDGM